MILVTRQMVEENAIKKQREREYYEAILKRAVNSFKSNDSAAFSGFVLRQLLPESFLIDRTHCLPNVPV